jgi:hypothetical protein
MILGGMSLVATAGLVVAATVTPVPAHAQAGEKVIVMGEDSDPTSFPRSSSVFERVLASLNEQMARANLRMVDEEMLAADLGWQIVDRRSKHDLVEAAKAANASPSGHHRSRLLALFRIHATKELTRQHTVVRTTISAELYDLHTNQFLGSHEVRTQPYLAAYGCNLACVEQTIGGRAVEIANDIGYVLRQKVRALAPEDSPTWAGPVTSYAVTLRDLDATDAARIEHVMATDFPGYVGHDILERTPSVVRLDYVSRARLAKLIEWIAILTGDIAAGRDVVVLAEKANIIVRRIMPNDASTALPDGRVR